MDIHVQEPCCTKKDQEEVISCNGQHRFLNLHVSKEVFVPISILGGEVYEKGGSE